MPKFCHTLSCIVPSHHPYIYLAHLIPQTLHHIQMDSHSPPNHCAIVKCATALKANLTLSSLKNDLCHTTLWYNIKFLGFLCGIWNHVEARSKTSQPSYTIDMILQFQIKVCIASKLDAWCWIQTLVQIQKE